MASNRHAGDSSHPDTKNIGFCNTAPATNKTHTGKKLNRTSSEHTMLDQRLALLTPRERLVLQGISEGKTNAMIAEELDIGELTTETCKQLIMLKLDVGSPAELAQIVADTLP